MFGPEIMARSISAANINGWQYHSRSDRHSKVACWAILFDLLQTCPLLRHHVQEGKVGFGINHEMRVFSNNRKKDLDLVVCTPRSEDASKKKKVKKATTFKDLVARYGVVLTPAEESILHSLPDLEMVPVGTVLVALEAKATMTEHIKARSRLHDELDASHSTVHGANDHAIAAGLATINLSKTFLSPGKQTLGAAPVWNNHVQPTWTEATIAKVRELTRRTRAGQHGFDAIGIVVVDMKNDGTPCLIANLPPAPSISDADHYDSMISRIASLYGSKFSTF